MLTQTLRRLAAPMTGRLAQGIARAGLSANAVTGVSLVLGLLAAGAAASTRWWPAIALWTLSSVCDALDGAVARLTCSPSALGRLLDSVTDKTCETALCLGLAWGAPSLRPAAVAALAAFLLCGYVSKAAQALGVPRPPSLIERPERVLFLALTMLTLAVDLPTLARAITWTLAAISALAFVLRTLRAARALNPHSARGSTRTAHDTPRRTG